MVMYYFYKSTKFIRDYIEYESMCYSSITYKI